MRPRGPCRGLRSVHILYEVLRVIGPGPMGRGIAMKRWLGSAALAVALSTSAMAMDMAPVFQTLPAPAAPAPYDWSGFYGGANASHAWGAAAADYAATAGATAT